MYKVWCVPVDDAGVTRFILHLRLNCLLAMMMRSLLAFGALALSVSATPTVRRRQYGTHKPLVTSVRHVFLQSKGWIVQLLY